MCVFLMIALVVFLLLRDLREVKEVRHNTWTGSHKGGMPLNVRREFWLFPAFGGETGSRGVRSCVYAFKNFANGVLARVSSSYPTVKKIGIIIIKPIRLIVPSASELVNLLNVPPLANRE
jgi:hypothetical protein